MAAHRAPRDFVSLGMFIIDEFSFADENGTPTEKTQSPQIGGGGTYASIGARIWLPPSSVGMVIDRGNDFPAHIQTALDGYGPDMWLYRDNPDRRTTTALNAYRGEYRGFEYLTPRIRITPKDLVGTKLDRPRILHFICSPTRAGEILSEVRQDPEWKPTTVYEPIPDRCVPEELPALVKVLPEIAVLRCVDGAAPRMHAAPLKPVHRSPNAEEALSLLSIPGPPNKELVEEACGRFLVLGVGPDGSGAVIIRSGAMGACVAQKGQPLAWVNAYWTGHGSATDKVVDVTGAGNSFLGGLGAGLVLANGDVREATLFATVSASFTIEQEGLPHLTRATSEDGRQEELWNGDSPLRRLRELQSRLETKKDASE
ncbi:Ribokinase-like protein [Trametes elegans]|nr:Ribokinase-like protein [Trametes elegans]